MQFSKFFSMSLVGGGLLARMILASAMVLVCLAEIGNAEIVVSNFEEPALAPKLNAGLVYEGELNMASAFRSGRVTFDNDGVYFGGSSWSGVGLSRRTVRPAGEEYFDNGNDLISKPATGAGGSATWAVIGTAGMMTADAGYNFTSLDITSTLYNWDSMVNGDPFAGGPMTNGGGTGRNVGQDDFFTVRFQNTANAASLDFNLADFRGAGDFVVDTWRNFNVSALNASQLSVSFLGSRESGFGVPPTFFLDTPAYAAIDNVTVTAVPEPGSLLLVAVLAGAVLGIGYARRRSTQRQGECVPLADWS